MKPIISIENLGKRYQIKHQIRRGGYRSFRDEIFQFPKRLFSRKETSEEFWALKDVSFDVMPGDRIGIIGRNGAGKSTLLKLLSRITEPSTGKVIMRGRVASLLEVGTGFHPELTGRENIFLNGAVLGMSRIEVKRKFDEIVDFAGVEQFLDTPVKRYSSGMYVRLAFSVAAHLEPDILIIDEVLAVGDADFQKKCLGKMEDVSKGQGRTVLFVSHNMGAIKQLCNKGILLDQGGLELQEDHIEKLLLNYEQQCTKPYKLLTKNRVTDFGFLKVSNIYLTDKENKNIDSTTVDNRFCLNVVFSLKESIDFGFCLHISTVLGESAFISISDTIYHLKGKYVSTCHIPKGTLNNGTFKIDLTVFLSGYKYATTEKDVLFFEVEDGVLGRKNYCGGYKGLSRPLLEWSTKSV